MRAVGQLDQADLLSGASPLPDDDRTRRLRRTGQVRGTRPPRPERSATRSASARTASTTSQLSWAVGCTASATPRTRSAPSCRSSWESRPSAALPGSALRPAESVHSSGRGWISTVGDHRALAARGVLVVDPKAHHLLISLHACGNSGERSTRAVAVPQRRTVPGRHRIWQRPPAPVRPWEPTPGYGRDTAAGPASPLGQHSPSGTNVESARPVAPPHELTAHGPTAHKTEATRADRRRGRTHRPSIPQAPRTGRGSHRSTGTGRTGVAPGERPGRDAGGFAAPGRRRPGRPTAGAAPWEGRCAFAAVGPVDAGVGSRSLVEVP
ncbi:hypothetical protein HNR68_001295 [Saccharopolyspora hordei]|uniref:Uncharacterized protein n=1 Tax=Saccharopolyspora hordei TaxID=1838 RepID=A0A853AEU5_9PSEU|nr:hypothetical protein [Saccharopolyspora hordei]